MDIVKEMFESCVGFEESLYEWYKSEQKKYKHLQFMEKPIEYRDLQMLVDDTMKSIPESKKKWAKSQKEMVEVISQFDRLSNLASEYSLKYMKYCLSSNESKKFCGSLIRINNCLDQMYR